jgi:glycosyltransferase involved in cell wall biosynthesis
VELAADRTGPPGGGLVRPEENPVISVVIPCFNQGRYIDDAVDSVLAQTRGDWEIIIVNDGSTEPETNERLRDYRRPNTRVITTPNRGLAAARNTGLRAASGAYLCALDADDALMPTWFERATAVLDRDASIAFVSCWLETFGHEQWRWTPERCDFPTLLDECTVCTAALVRSAAVREAGGFDEGMPAPGYEDWDLWISLVERGARGVVLPEVQFRYRRHPESMSKICASPEVHTALMHYLVAKHQSAYARHLDELILLKEAAAANVLRSVYQVERMLDAQLLPAIARKEAEIDRLRRRLAPSAPPASAGPEVAALHARIEALERSLSWRITAPLRRACDVLAKLTRRPTA